MRRARQCVHAPPNKKPKATTQALRRGEARRDLSLYIALKPLEHFISKLSRRALKNLARSRPPTPSAVHSNMCSGSWFWSSSGSGKEHPSLVVVNLERQLKKTLAVRRRRRLRLRRLRDGGAEAMEMVNLKLYLENRCIIAENERLRERASALRRENLALLQNLSSRTAAVPEPGAGAA
ncbi:protein LITTLE ZIPPER 2 [Zea mays]|uniref:Uncharacterized protein n=3 Tax=Zea mays TaxID=4577 RepID=A0A1D6ET93_MAIZE|nr:protein LITTLE ZIPPER 2 [Zea mays]ONM22927.1 hypothetical protein ZEAMMB73_Zm00001d006158 [Zea mays]|eukprot:NP_001307394.1 uncharacterized protein LOC100501092 [Zea mays]